jgi:NADPH:quinone reductase-like Zn-dependent oxidoreductase
MKAFVVDRYGDADTVHARKVPDPTVGEDDVLVRVHAASVNPLDLKISSGGLKTILPYRLPFVLGNDLAGTVTAVGSRVTRFTVGDQVYARPDQNRIGAFAELIAMRQDDVAAKPASLTMEEAASIPLVGLTAWQALVERADLRPGQRVLIHAGAGGVGTIAIQLAKHLGAHVATTASSSKTDLVKSLGADVVVDYTMQAFETVLRDYDVVLDTVGGETLDKSMQVLKPGGIVISIAGPPDPAFAKQAGANPVIRLAVAALSFPVRQRARRHRVRYSFLFMKASGDQLRQLSTLLDAGTIRPVLDRTFDFASTREALAHVEQGRAKAGKVVIRFPSVDTPAFRPERKRNPCGAGQGQPIRRQGG